MSTENLESIFWTALEMAAPEERAAYLERTCGPDGALRRRVEQLLEAHAQAGSFLQALPSGLAATVEKTRAPGSLGQRIGPYKLLQQIGEGGMGTVYMAEQEQPVRRRVALKIIKPGMDSAQVIARFEAERQTLALMDHLNIAKVLDAGTSEADRPYFAMELVHGVPITQYCDDNRLTPGERLELFIPVCQAIQHAHQKGIIHRDIKPSNVLVTLYDGRPVPKVIDFGVAKATEQRLTDRTMFTQFGSVVGTFEYMAPEQAEMNALGVDTRSDVYSLGVVLYELLTGTTPLERTKVREAAVSDLLRMIREVEPRRPSVQVSVAHTLPQIAAARKTEPARLSRLIQGELDWIVMKCLEKDRTRRYESASALARDLQRYLADEPVEACPPSAAYLLRRFTRKYRTALVATGAFMLLLVVAVVISTWQALRATHAEQQMQAERDRAVAAQRDLQLAVTRQAAERLESHLLQLEMVGKSIEATFLQEPSWKEEWLERWLSDLIKKDDRINGLTLAFEPHQFDSKLEDYCLYVYRSSEGITKKHLHPPEYPYRKRDWYRTPLREGARWSQPCFDEGGANIVGFSYLLPLRREGKVIGVATVDVSVDDFFKRLGDGLAEVKRGRPLGESYGFVISSATAPWNGKSYTGVFLNHPQYRYPQKSTELRPADDSFTVLVQRMLREKNGSGTAVDPWTGKRATFLFSPVPSAEWVFVAVVD